MLSYYLHWLQEWKINRILKLKETKTIGKKLTTASNLNSFSGEQDSPQAFMQDLKKEFLESHSSDWSMKLFRKAFPCLNLAPLAHTYYAKYCT